MRDIPSGLCSRGKHVFIARKPECLPFERIDVYVTGTGHCIGFRNAAFLYHFVIYRRREDEILLHHRILPCNIPIGYLRVYIIVSVHKYFIIQRIIEKLNPRGRQLLVFVPVFRKETHIKVGGLDDIAGARRIKGRIGLLHILRRIRIVETFSENHHSMGQVLDSTVIGFGIGSTVCRKIFLTSRQHHKRQCQHQNQNFFHVINFMFSTANIARLSLPSKRKSAAIAALFNYISISYKLTHSLYTQQTPTGRDFFSYK